MCLPGVSEEPLNDAAWEDYVDDDDDDDDDDVCNSFNVGVSNLEYTAGRVTTRGSRKLPVKK
jgi:hypothetical protein